MKQQELIPKVPPSEDEVLFRASAIGLSVIEAYRFFNFYESNGWKVGKSKMKNWSAALVGWKLRYEQERASRQRPAEVPIHVRLRAVEELIARHPANSDSTCHNPKCSAEQRNDYQALKKKRDLFLRQIVNI